MEPKNLEQVRSWLRNRLGKVDGEITSSLSQLSSDSSHHHLADLDDLASDASVEDVIHARFHSSGETLREIERALEKLEESTYGLCDDCHGEIAEPRLKAIPFATCCVTCKAQREREGGR